jgi:hypothetical protein
VVLGATHPVVGIFLAHGIGVPNGYGPVDLRILFKLTTPKRNTICLKTLRKGPEKASH